MNVNEIIIGQSVSAKIVLSVHPYLFFFSFFLISNSQYAVCQNLDWLIAIASLYLSDKHFFLDIHFCPISRKNKSYNFKCVYISDKCLVAFLECITI